MTHYVSAKAVQEEFGWKMRTIYDWANQGKMPGAYKLNGIWLFNLSVIAKWVSEKESVKCQSRSVEKHGTLNFNLPGKQSANQLEQLLGLRH